MDKNLITSYLAIATDCAPELDYKGYLQFCLLADKYRFCLKLWNSSDKTKEKPPIKEADLWYLFYLASNDIEEVNKLLEEASKYAKVKLTGALAEDICLDYGLADMRATNSKLQVVANRILRLLASDDLDTYLRVCNNFYNAIGISEKDFTACFINSQFLVPSKQERVQDFIYIGAALTGTPPRIVETKFNNTIGSIL